MKSNVISVKVDDEMKANLQALAKEKDVPVSQIIREAIKHYEMYALAPDFTVKDNGVSINDLLDKLNN